MKLIIFGTGYIYQKYKKFMDMSVVECFADNSRAKNGMEIDGARVYFPSEIDFEPCTYVVIMVEQYQPIAEQLSGLGVPLSKIRTYKDLADLFSLDLTVSCNAGGIELGQWVDMHNKGKRIFVLSHSLARSGVPIALMNLSFLLKEMSYEVLYGALDEGNLENELLQKEIDFIGDLWIIKSYKRFMNLIKQFDILIVGTLVLSELGSVLVELNLPTIWWLHESEQILFEKHKLPLRNNVHYYGVGKRVIEVFGKYYPNEKIEKLCYFLPPTPISEKRAHTFFTFALIGWYGRRKAQDIFISALKLIPDQKRKEIRTILVCPSIEKVDEAWKRELKKALPIQIFGELSQEEILQLYKEIDVLVCPSRDDPMPIVVSQAMQNQIPCIVSNQVGQCEFLTGNNGGYVFENENVEQLAKIMEYCIEHPDEMREKGKEAYDIFQGYFSQEVIKKRIEEVIIKIL